MARVILGGIRRIGRVTSKLVPFMAALYVGASMIVLLLHIDQVPATLALIFASAFTPAAQIGGLPAAPSYHAHLGIKTRALLERVGQGSAPIAHAAAKTDEPIREGVVAMLGPFIDTLLICTMTSGDPDLRRLARQAAQQLVVNEQSAIEAVDRRPSAASVQINGDMR